MTTSQDIVGDTAYAKAMKLWLHKLKTIGWLPAPEPKLLQEAGDTYFDVAQDVFTFQRKVANGVLTVTTSAPPGAGSRKDPGGAPRVPLKRGMRSTRRRPPTQGAQSSVIRFPAGSVGVGVQTSAIGEFLLTDGRRRTWRTKRIR
ncbi:MAG: hypothetical protein JO272_18475 [Pseudonocardiales bacterium]|nr:hypothetical protein [Pseudonocardiales bacterium]